VSLRSGRGWSSRHGTQDILSILTMLLPGSWSGVCWKTRHATDIAPAPAVWHQGYESGMSTSSVRVTTETPISTNTVPATAHCMSRPRSDADLDEYGACYCALYVSPEISRGEKTVTSIPERRPVGGPTADAKEMEQVPVAELAFPVWRCKVCGYLCARPQPPLVCPVCKAGKERFERFM